jgi:hypothetical protein
VNDDRTAKPWKVLRAGIKVSEHKHYGQALDDARDNNADEVYYLNSRGLGVTVWPLGGPRVSA